MGIDLHKKYFVSTIIRVLKKSFFSQSRSWANKNKILSAGLFLKNNKPTLMAQLEKLARQTNCRPAPLL